MCLEFCICKNKYADQLRSNCEADQRLCFCYTNSTIPLLSEFEISSLKPFSVAVQPGLCQTWSGIPKTGFHTMRLKCNCLLMWDISFLFQNYTAEVFHISFGVISLGNSMFLMPSYSRLCPLISSDLHQVELQYNNRAGKVWLKISESERGV